MSEKIKRMMRVFKSLDGHPLIGISNKEIADALGIKPVDVSRDLSDLIDSGLVVKLDNGNFAYSIKMLKIAENFRQQQERLTARLQELEQRIY